MSTAYFTTRRIGPHKRKLVYNNVNHHFLKRIYSKKHIGHMCVLLKCAESNNRRCILDSLHKEK